jgi:hypothetical protein
MVSHVWKRQGLKEMDNNRMVGTNKGNSGSEAKRRFTFVDYFLWSLYAIPPAFLFTGENGGFNAFMALTVVSSLNWLRYAGRKSPRQGKNKNTS